MNRVTGLGGIFYQVADPAKTIAWYSRHLGFQTSPWGASFFWGDLAGSKVGRTEWSPMKSDQGHFAPGTHPFMINYRVENLDELLTTLKSEGVTVLDERQHDDVGKFGWIIDPEGRKIELWEPLGDQPADEVHVGNERVTGIGGVFFKSRDTKAIKAWYQKHLGIEGIFQWKDLGNSVSEAIAQTIWSPFKDDTEYFSPGDKPYMFNYRVHDLAGLVEKLKGEGIPQIGKIDEYDYGKFAWIMDPDGHKVELWEAAG